MRTADSAGNIFVADRNNHKIRKIAPNGAVSTFAGMPEPAVSAASVDGPLNVARFNQPTGVAGNSADNLYATVHLDQVNLKITPDGTVRTIAGGVAGSSGAADGTGLAAQFSRPGGVAVDNAGNVYAADTGNNTIRKGIPFAHGTARADINDDTESDLVFQHEDGTLAVWFLYRSFLNQSSLFTPSNPGAGWRVVGVADRNRDGNPDLLFQQENLDLAVWFMDGTNRASRSCRFGARPSRPQQVRAEGCVERFCSHSQHEPAAPKMGALRARLSDPTDNSGMHRARS